MPQQFATPGKDAYAYTPSDDPSTWKLRIDDAGHVGGAAAALGPGFRGQKVQLPAGARAGVVAKVRAAWKKFHPDEDADTMPAALKASEPGDPEWEQEDADGFAGIIAALNVAIQRESAELGNDPSDAETVQRLLFIREALCEIQADEQAEAMQADEPGVGDLAVPTLIGAAKPGNKRSRLASKLKDKLTGQKREAFEPQRFTEDGAVGLSFMEPPDWIPYMPVPHTSKHPEYGDVALTAERNARFVQNFKAAVYQKELPIDSEHDLIGGGAFAFVTDMRQNGDGSVDAKVRWTDRGTTAVKGDRFTCISPQWFDKWTDKVTGQTYEDVAVGGALTNRPFFKHSTLRPLAASEHIIGAVYAPAQQQEAMQMADPGIAVSDSGTHDAFTGQHAHSHTGGDGETHSEMHKHQNEGNHSHDCTDAMPFAATEGTMPNEQETRTFAEERAALQSEIAALRQASESQAEALKAASEAIAKQFVEAQTKRFTDEIMGRSDANGTRWYIPTQGGEEYKTAVERQVSTLRGLEKAFGEGSEEVKAYVEQQRMVAQTMRSSEVLKAAGLPGGGDPASADARIKAFAEQIHTADPRVSLERAMLQAIEAHPDLYEQSENERKARAARGV